MNARHPLLAWIGSVALCLAGCSSTPPAPPPAPAAPASAPTAAAPRRRSPCRAASPTTRSSTSSITDRFENGDPANDGATAASAKPAPKDDVAHLPRRRPERPDEEAQRRLVQAARRQRDLDHRALRADPRLGGRRQQGIQALRLPRLLRARLHAARHQHGHARRPARDGRHRACAGHPHAVRRGDEPPGLPRHPDRARPEAQGAVAGARDARRSPTTTASSTTTTSRSATGGAATGCAPACPATSTAAATT